MIRIIAVAFLLVSTTALQAQHGQDEFSREFPVIAQFAGGALHGWEVAGGESTIDHDGLKLGKAETKLRLTAPLGEEFKLELAYTMTGPSRPTLHWDGNSWMMPSGGGDHTLIVPCTKQGGWGSRFYLRYKHEVKSVGGHSTSTGGVGGGSGRIRELAIVVPTDCTLTIRRLTLQSSTPLVTDSSGLYIGLGILAVCILAIMGLGWLLNRKRVVRSQAPGS